MADFAVADGGYDTPSCFLKFDVDWAAMYGPEWAPMNGIQPASVILAVGSEISVYPKG